MAIEETYYSDARNSIYITDTRIIVGQSSFYLRNITSSTITRICDSPKKLLKNGFIGRGEMPEFNELLEEEKKVENTTGWRDAIVLLLTAIIGIFSGVAMYIELESAFGGVLFFVLGTSASYFIFEFAWRKKRIQAEGYEIIIQLTSGEAQSIKHLSKTEIEEINSQLNIAISNFR